MKKEIISTLFIILLLVLFGSCIREGAIKDWAVIPTIPGATYVGGESCLDCHDEVGEQFDKTIHGRIASFEVVDSKRGCESCHGPGSVHMEEPGLENIITFKNISKDEASAVCLKCHASGSHMDWLGSEHPLNNVGCIDCHQSHSQTKDLLVKPQPGLCNECHLEIKVKTLYPSHHPIQEGKMVCTDCHQPHGGLFSSLKTEERLNDLCFECHASYQGPFTFEHEPVVEDCSVCHDAHGTVANNLLVQNEPFLCLQCHQFHFHAGKVSDSGTFTNIYGDTVTSEAHGFKMAYTTKCTQCHSQVHGSDLPSQGTSSQGRSLTR